MACRSSRFFSPLMTPLLTLHGHCFGRSVQLSLRPRKISGVSVKGHLHESNSCHLHGISCRHALPQINLLHNIETREQSSNHQVGCCKFESQPSSNYSIQGQGNCKAQAMAFLITNALMLTCPFEVLAETCEMDGSVFSKPALLFVALVGSTVGGLLARQRKGELKRLNEQLRQINTALRRQAKIESYTPALSYASVGSRIPEAEAVVDKRKDELISRLKSGKNFLRNQDLEKAFHEFQTALELARDLNDPTEEKKAARGSGASLQRQGKYRDAIKYHSMVLQISERVGEDSGNTEAYGAIADCYTELGDLERAGRFYDKYISRLESD